MKNNKIKITILLIIVLVISIFSSGCFKTDNAYEYTVIFQDYDGTEIKIETGLKKGASVDAPTDPIREGYVFIGWDKEFDNITENIIVTAQYELTNKPIFIVSSVSAKAGEENVKISIDVKQNPNIASIGLTLTYDKSLTLINISYNEDIGGYSISSEHMTSPVKLTWISPLANVSGDFTFVTLEFTVAEDAKANLPIEITYNPDDVYDMTEENIEFDVINGSINIVE